MFPDLPPKCDRPPIVVIQSFNEQLFKTVKKVFPEAKVCRINQSGEEIQVQIQISNNPGTINQDFEYALERVFKVDIIR